MGSIIGLRALRGESGEKNGAELFTVGDAGVVATLVTGMLVGEIVVGMTDGDTSSTPIVPTGPEVS